MPHFGPLEIGLVLIVMMMIFGVGKLPQVGKHLGQGIKEFRKATLEDTEEKE